MRFPRLAFPRPRPVFAGFALGLRAPLRSRFVFALLALLGAAVLLLPVQLKGDGTDAGALRMLLTWTLGVAVALLSVSTLWAGCAAVSGDVEGKRHAGAAVSSARPFELWLGRWLGLVALDAAVLALVLAAVFVQVRLRGLGPDATAVREYLPVDPASFEEEVDRILADAIARMPPEVRPDGDPERRAAMRASVRKDLAGDSYLPLDPGRERRWRFRLPWADGRRVFVDDRAGFEFSFLSSYGDKQGVRGLLRLLAGDGRELARREVTTDDNGFFRLSLDAQAIVKALGGGDVIEAVFENTEGEGGASVLLRHDRTARLSVPAGGLASNLFRAGIAVLALLSLLAALGLACGCALSFPVAAFAATALCAMVAVSGGSAFSDGADGDAGHGHSHGISRGVSAAIRPFARHVARALDAATEPCNRAEALDRLGDGVAVSGRAAWRAFALDGVALPLLLGLLGAGALRRRETP